MESFFKTFNAHLPCALLVFLFAGFSQNISARENLVVILSSGQSPTYKNLINEMMDVVNANNSITATFNVIYLEQPPSNNNLNIIPVKTDLIVAVGKHATDIALSTESGTPILSTLLPRKSFLLSVSTYKNLLEGRERKITSIHLDNPPIRQILLAKILLGNSKRLSILTSEPYSDYIKLVKNSANKAENIIYVEPVNPTDNIIKKLAYALHTSDALLALPDAFIYNRKTAQSILLTTYRHRTPVIAFSSAYVKAGALAAIYSSPEQIAKQTGEVLIDIIKSQFNSIPSPVYPKYFSVSINQNVARSLNIRQIDEADAYKNLLDLLEKIQ